MGQKTAAQLVELLRRERLLDMPAPRLTLDAVSAPNAKIQRVRKKGAEYGL